MAEQDQQARQARDDQQMDVVDAANLRQLRQMVERSGWPTISQVGAEAARAAWLLAQHADIAPDFQQQCLALMQQYQPAEVDPEWVAYLEDRVLVNTKKPQRYGTQWHVTSGGTFEPHPIANEETIDQLRQAAGMERFAEYSAMMRRMYTAQNNS